MSNLTTRIPIKDRNGNVISEKEVATYAGLLARAHEEGLKSVQTEVLQFPTPDNGEVCIVRATVETSHGLFAGIGDANPRNVNPRIAPHCIRMAETRAKARALRDAVNIGVVSLEELGGEDDVQPQRDTRSAPPPRVAEVPAARVNDARSRAANDGRAQNLDDRVQADIRRAPPAGRVPDRQPQQSTGREMEMTENQRRWLYRFLSERGFEGQGATDALCRAAEVQDVRQITKSAASALIDQWKQDEGGSRAA